MADLKTFAEQLVNLSVKEVSELADILKNEYGIEPAATAVAPPTPTYLIKFLRLIPFFIRILLYLLSVQN